MTKGNIPVDLFCASYLCNCTYELNSSLNSVDRQLEELVVVGLALGEEWL